MFQSIAPDTLEGMVWVTLALGVVSTLIGRWLTGVWISATSSYWGGWVIVYCFGLYSDWLGVLKPVSEVTHELVMELHIAALITFTLASMVFRRDLIVSFRRLEKSFWPYELFLEKYFIIWASIIFLFGVAHFGERLSEVGGNVTNLFFELRMNYLEGRKSPIQRVTSYLSQSGLLLVILCGVSDALHGVRMKRLYLLVLASAPNGLAMGGRGFLLGFFIPYVIALATTVQIMPKTSMVRALLKRRLIAVLPRAAVFFLMAVTIFAVLGETRARGDSNEGFGGPKFLRFTAQFAGWFASTLWAIAPATDFYEDTVPLGYGRDTIYPWINSQIERTGLLPGTRESDTNSVILEFRKADGGNLGLGFIPPSIIPYLVWDWGREHILFGAVLYLLICHLGSVFVRPSSVMAFLCIVLSVQAAFYTVQVPWLLHGPTMWAMMWALVIAYLVRRTFPEGRVRKILAVRRREEEKMAKLAALEA